MLMNSHGDVTLFQMFCRKMKKSNCIQHGRNGCVYLTKCLIQTLTYILEMVEHLDLV